MTSPEPTAIPPTFRALVADQADDRVDLGLRELAPADLPRGEVEVRVRWSSLNYKDGLATVPGARVARIPLLVPGIDLVGEVIASADAAIRPGQIVICHGYDLGTAHHGGFAEYARVPAAWIVPLPDGLTARESMALGTAGFTAALSVAALEDRGLRPSDGPVLVTGASGGVGTSAVGILGARGYEVWAATGKPDERERLRGLGAVGFLDRSEVTGPGRPLESERWAGAVDTVGAATLPYILRTLRIDAAVAASGNAAGAELATTVFPFILRGVGLLGMSSASTKIERRREIWRRLADPADLRPRGLGEALTEVTLETLPGAIEQILAGRARGRWIVRLGG
jgi:acrylyl-CoA reductase (NADPH)